MEKVYITSSLVKKIILFLAIAVIFAASCTRNVVKVNRQYNTAGSLTSIPTNFVLTKFANSITNEDSTVLFNGYVFSFGSDGKVTVIKDNQTTIGNYIELHTSDKLELGLNFYSTPLSYLNDYWWASVSNTSIELSDPSTGGVLEFSAQ
jgi:putative transposon-encoded protein